MRSLRVTVALTASALLGALLYPVVDTAVARPPDLAVGTQAAAAERAAASEIAVEPGLDWRDTDGNLIEAHGGGLLKQGDTYYWYGEDKAASHNGFAGINVYTSKDLKRWTAKGQALAPQGEGDLGPQNVGERPKVVYNAKTGKYVMWLHIDDRATYLTARVGVAVADSPGGPYTYRGSFRPLERQSRDMTLFQDRDGRAYLVFSSANEAGKPNSRLRIAQLSDDYLSVSGQTHAFPENQYREAPAVAHIGNTYYMLTSFTTGWSPNPVKYATARSLRGPWSEWKSLVDDSEVTYRSQPTAILEVNGSHGTTHMYLGDRWVPSKLNESRYVWLPLQLGGGKARMEWHDRWYLDLARGTWRPETNDTGAVFQAEARTSTVSGAARFQPCGEAQCARGLGNGDSLTMTVRSPQAGRKTLRLYYVNDHTEMRRGHLAANGGEAVVRNFPPTDGRVRWLEVTATLKKGANSLTLGNPSEGAPDLDFVTVQS